MAAFIGIEVVRISEGFSVGNVLHDNIRHLCGNHDGPLLINFFDNRQKVAGRSIDLFGFDVAEPGLKAFFPASSRGL